MKLIALPQKQQEEKEIEIGICAQQDGNDVNITVVFPDNDAHLLGWFYIRDEKIVFKPAYIDTCMRKYIAINEITCLLLVK